MAKKSLLSAVLQFPKCISIIYSCFTVSCLIALVIHIAVYSELPGGHWHIYIFTVSSLLALFVCLSVCLFSAAATDVAATDDDDN